MHVRFQTPHQYLFIHRDVKHLLLLWQKEHKRDLYIVEEEEPELLLRFPGQTYVEMVLDEVEPLFFQQLEGESGTFPVILGATFTHQEKLFAMYYEPERLTEELYFFLVQGEEIAEIPDEEYEQVVQAFIEQFPEYFTS